ncbi:S9 family peptidase, partial [Candidatus Bathyarchaeota archaeon]
GEGGFTELLYEFDAIYTFVDNEGDTFYFMTDLDAPMGRVISVDLNAPERENWREVVGETSDSLRAVSMVGDMFIATYVHDAYSRVKVYAMDGGYVRDVKLPGLGNVMGFEGEQGDPETFYMFMSHIDPGAVYRYDVEADETKVFRRPKLQYDSEDYSTEQVFYASKDGTRVPMFVSYRKGLERNGKNPTYLTGYGGFNIPSMPRFSVRNLLWMEMGGVYAQANLRGGGEYGKEWHEAGTKLRKQNVFDDFIAAAEWLIENGYTDTPHLAISGRSNGGLLAGACLVQRPDLYGVVLPIVGVLDMLRFEKFTVGRGWVSDYGSVDDPDEFSALLAYSPYHNLVPGTEYPPTLITTGDHDDRVFPAHSFKFAAAMQAAHAGGAPVLIRIDTKAGHGGGKPSAKLIEEYTDELAFIVENLGVEC